MKRNLTLKRETLTELSSADLARVAGGDPSLSCPIKVCLTETYSARCPGYSYTCETSNCS